MMQPNAPHVDGEGVERVVVHSLRIRHDAPWYTHAAMKPITIAPYGATTEHPAVIATRPPSSELHVCPRS